MVRWPDASQAPYKPIMPLAIIESSAAMGLAIAVGLLLIFFGRRIFWIFVGGIGFFAGMQFAPMLAPTQPQWIILLFGVLLGIIGSVLAIVLQRVAVAVAGWLAGGLLAIRLAAVLGWSDPTIVWVVFILGAIVAAVLFSLFFDWAVIALTSLSGAVLLCDGLSLAPTMELMISVVLVAAGFLIQARDLVKPMPALANDP